MQLNLTELPALQMLMFWRVINNSSIDQYIDLLFSERSLRPYWLNWHIVLYALSSEARRQVGYMLYILSDDTNVFYSILLKVWGLSYAFYKCYIHITFWYHTSSANWLYNCSSYIWKITVTGLCFVHIILVLVAFIILSPSQLKPASFDFWDSFNQLHSLPNLRTRMLHD